MLDFIGLAANNSAIRRSRLYAQSGGHAVYHPEGVHPTPFSVFGTNSATVCITSQFRHTPKLVARSTEETCKVAHHEAAHALVGMLLGAPIESVSIEASEDEGIEGRTIHEFGEIGKHLGGVDWARMAKAITNYAGHLAEIHLGFKDEFEETGAHGDYLKAAIALQDITGGNEEKFDALQESALATARMMVELCWPQIELVAEMLVKNGTLSGDEVREILTNDS